MASGEFSSKIAGVTATNADGYPRQKYIRAYCKPGQRLILKPEPDNPYDSNAVGVWLKARVYIFFSVEVQIGYLSADICGEISRHIKNGGNVAVTVRNITGGSEQKNNLGVNIAIKKT